jgi:hypothetical protein
MKDIQVAEISLNIINGDLFSSSVKKTVTSNSKVHSGHRSVLVNDISSPIVSFYKKAFISAKLKKEYKKNNLEINDVFFKSDFEKLSDKAYDFFLSHEFEENNLKKIV